MFATAQAQPVSRNELHSPPSSRETSPDPAFTELFRSRIAPQELSYTTVNGIDDAVSDDGSEAELRLFAGPSAAPGSTQKIRVASPDLANLEPGLLRGKPHDYYFSDVLDAKKRTEFEAMAVSGETILAWSKIPWPGCALPWKVHKITIKSEKKVAKPLEVCQLTTSEKSRRKRAGKKKRIALRKKAQRDAEKAEEALKKEQEEREKKTRRNREKKIKKKMREKAKKAQPGDGADSGQNAEAGAVDMDVD